MYPVVETTSLNDNLMIGTRIHVEPTVTITLPDLTRLEAIALIDALRGHLDGGLTEAIPPTPAPAMSAMAAAN